MHPVLSSVRALSWYLLAWLAGGCAAAWVLVVSAGHSWHNALWFALPVCLTYAFIIPSAYYVGRALPFTRRRLVAGMALFAAASAMAGAATWGLAHGWNRISLALEQDWAGLTLTHGMGLALFGLAAGGYLASLLTHDVLVALDQMREAQRRALEARALAQEAELQMLRTQINPHFLFNCLNSISALTSMDPAAARAMAIALAQYFRQTLALSEQASVPLAQEIAHCQCFLDIEAMRFGDKLAVEITVDEAASSAQVPPMVLQPLVENAVKHGIAHSSRPGTICIHATVQTAWLHLRVDNPLETDASVASSPPGLGLGLRNIAQRLRTLHGDQARIRQHVADQRFVVELTLPYSASPVRGTPTT